MLPDAFAQDAERLARFQHEAKSLASLNHPNIAAIHSVHEADGLRFLAMELVPGEDLSQRIARGSVPLDEAVEIARQVCAGLRISVQIEAGPLSKFGDCPLVLGNHAQRERRPSAL